MKHLYSHSAHLPRALRWTLAAVAMIPLAALAQNVPNSGQLLQQARQHKATRPVHQPRVRIQPQPTARSQSNTPFLVKRIVIDGATAFSVATLHALIASGEGHKITLAGLQALAGRITAYYHAHGYPLARAIVPAQTLDNGTVHLRVIEACYDRIAVHNTSGVSTALVRATLEPLQPGQVVTQASLDRALLLLGDIPGVKPHAVLSPGRTVGTTQVDVTAAAAPRLTGDVYLDNAGTRYGGRARLGADLAFNNPLHHGDQLRVSALTAGSTLSYGRVTYAYTLNGIGTRIGAGYSALHYHLSGDAVSALDAHGTARVASAWLAQPLVRGRNTSLDARLQFDHTRLDDDIGATGFRNPRHTNNWTLSLFGEHRDSWLGGGLTRAGIDLTRGSLHLDNAAAAAADAATARTAGNFTRWDAYVSRLQRLAAGWHLYAGVHGQSSGDNLDSAQQFLLGGPHSVRGYEVGTLAGSSGWVMTLALRHQLACGRDADCQGRLFIDTGAVRINADPWTTARNHERVSSAGIGFHWSGAHHWLVRVQAAVPIGAAPDTAHHGAQVWARVRKGF